MEDIKKQKLLSRIQSYLGNGGLFNPEIMDHDKVRELIIDCRDYILENTTNCSYDYEFQTLDGIWHKVYENENKQL